ncbi:GSCFA domain-containing protein [Celeribacter neptunius]|uniref:GSCFA family protein n=1 Tax=Celeribacter neptunius TaxID=588602 RepID=A0A1I3LM81_9RHOB|nr:GSCFA domain-containing protein [Celeribacter neptunius]SFI85889.1 GSCFA family protein [Celeribacter neptunius]
MTHPYEDIPPEGFWRSGVVETDRMDWPGLHKPKFHLTHTTRVATAGSCFAQHIGRYLRLAGINVLDGEPAPKGMGEELATRFGYGLYSARYGNIYTARQMRELLEDAMAGRVDKRLFLTRKGRWYDMLRPGVEPTGCASLEEAMELRRAHLEAVLALISSTDVLVFTLGLTEGWIDKRAGKTLAMAPGVIAGRYRERRFAFHNFSYDEVLEDLRETLRLMQELNPNIKLLLTVSPVPLTATASGDHVLSASSYSKSVLRAAAGDVAAGEAAVDYFPSYEIVTSTAMAATAYEANLRGVTQEMVETVMGVFLVAHGLLDALAEMEAGETAHGARAGSDVDLRGLRALSGPAETDEEDADVEAPEDELICEEALLEALRK